VRRGEGGSQERQWLECAAGAQMGSPSELHRTASDGSGRPDGGRGQEVAGDPAFEIGDVGGAAGCQHPRLHTEEGFQEELVEGGHAQSRAAHDSHAAPSSVRAHGCHQVEAARLRQARRSPERPRIRNAAQDLIDLEEHMAEGKGRQDTAGAAAVVIACMSDQPLREF